MVEGARLESVYTLIRIEGSNPSLSARPKKGPRNAGLFIWSGGEKGLGENPRFDKSRKRFGPKIAPAFSAYGTSLCLTAAGAPARPGLPLSLCDKSFLR